MTDHPNLTLILVGIFMLLWGIALGYYLGYVEGKRRYDRTRPN